MNEPERRTLKIKILDKIRLCLNDELRDIVAEGLSTDDPFLEPIRRFRHEVEEEIEYLHKLDNNV